MEIRIGIINAPRELSFETSQSAAEVAALVAGAIDEGAKFLQLNDNKGKVYIVPMASVAYVEVGSDEARRIGFVG